MRGSPPVQLALLLLGFFIVGVPLVQLTHGRVDSAAVTKTGLVLPGGKTPVFIRVRYAHRPSKLSLKWQGEDLLAKADLAASPVECRADAAIAEHGLECSLTAEWPAGTPSTALTVEVEPDHLEGRSQTSWSIDGRIEDTVSFIWK